MKHTIPLHPYPDEAGSTKPFESRLMNEVPFSFLFGTLQTQTGFQPQPKAANSTLTVNNKINDFFYVPSVVEDAGAKKQNRKKHRGKLISIEEKTGHAGKPAAIKESQLSLSFIKNNPAPKKQDNHPYANTAAERYYLSISPAVHK